jgi:hypothetical protein
MIMRPAVHTETSTLRLQLGQYIISAMSLDSKPAIYMLLVGKAMVLHAGFCKRLLSDVM